MRAALKLARRRLRRDRRARARRGARQWRPRPARRLLHGEHGDRRRPGLRLRHPLRATACSARRSPTAGRSSCPRPGSSTATPGSSSAARPPTRSASAAASSTDEPNGADERYVWQPGRAGAWRSPTTRRSSAGAAARVNTLRLWTADADRPDPARRLQRRRPYRRAAREQHAPKR